MGIRICTDIYIYIATDLRILFLIPIQIQFPFITQVVNKTSSKTVTARAHLFFEEKVEKQHPNLNVHKFYRLSLQW